MNRLSANEIEFEFSKHALTEEVRELERVLIFSWEARQRDIENRLKFFNEEYRSCELAYDLQKQQLLAQAGAPWHESLPPVSQGSCRPYRQKTWYCTNGWLVCRVSCLSGYAGNPHLTDWKK